MAQRRTGIIGVFPDEQKAQQAAQAARRAGVDPSVIHIGTREAQVASLRAEMHDEVETSLMGPGNVGPFTKEQTRTMVPATVVGAIVGLLIALPFAAIGFGDWPLWGRMLIVAVVGVAVGSVVGFQIGGMYGARRPEEPLAAERGVTIEIDDAPESAVAALRDLEPLQLDAIDRDGRPLGSVLGGDEVSERGVVDTLRHHATDRDLEG
jgi:hypothetical protein